MTDGLVEPAPADIRPVVTPHQPDPNATAM